MSPFTPDIKREMSGLPPSRRALRARRRSLSPREQLDHAVRVARRLRKHPFFLRARRVGIYWSSDGELDLSPLLDLTHSARKRWFLPVLRAHPGRKLWFIDYRRGEPLVKNVYGIPEPQLRHRRIRLPSALDLLLVPLVGFDVQCNRLGMGGGYYDRTLAYLRLRRYWHRPVLAGIAHECQRVTGLEPRPWEVPLDLVVTEARVYPSNDER
jgi:5-formyltetrahydrofolate cyclo-ligase